MVAARSVTVKLKLDSSAFNRGLAEAAASANAFQKALHDDAGGGVFSGSADDAHDFSTSVDEGTGSLKAFRRELDGAGGSNDRFGKGITASNGRMALLVQYGLALGPALVPALAAAVPLAAALGAGLAAASVGAGVAVLAFQGVGDALTAMNNYAIDPTEAHLKALNQAMDTLGPAGQEFVVFLQDLRPEIQQLQNIAQQGLFPGIQDGIESVLTQMPLIQGVIANVSTAMGELAREGGEALTSPFWTEFFTYIKNDATQIITDFSVGFGKLFEGISALVLDFAPLTSEIAAGFADMGRSFSSWAQNLPNTQGFQDFLQYLRDTGPQVLDTFANLGKAFLDVGVALSGLPAQEALFFLNSLATIISGIASSPVGPGLLAVAVGLSAITRAIALFDTVQASALMQFLGGKRGSGTGTVSKVGGVLGGLLSQKGAIVGAIGLIGLSLTDLDEKMGVTRTLSGAAIGSIFGAPGAAVGAVVGGIMDTAHAYDELNEKVEHQVELAQQLQTNDPFNVDAQASTLKGLQESAVILGALHDKLGDGNAMDDVFGDPGALGKNLDLINAEIESFTANQEALRTVLRSVGDALGGDYVKGVQGLKDILDDAQPALDHFKLTTDDLVGLQRGAALSSAGSLGLDIMIDKIAAYTEKLNSVPGREKAVGQALADIGAGASNSQADVDALAASLDNLFAPALDYSQAVDDWRLALMDLAKNLKGSSLDPDTRAGIANRNVIRDQVADLLNVIKTGAAEHGVNFLTRQLEAMRQQMINVGKEAGLRGPELRDFLATLNLTPKDIRVIVRAAGIEQAQQDAKQLKKDYEALPEDVKTDLEANGVPANATVASLMAKYDTLSRKQVLTILRAQDNASGVARRVLGVMRLLEHTFTSTLNVNTNHNNTTTNTIATRHIRAEGPSADGNLFEFANGGMWPYPSIGSQQPQIQPNRGPGGIMWAETGAGPWEAFISGHPNKIDRSRDIATEVVDRLGGVVQFADGGQVGRHISPSDIGRRATRSDLSFMRDLEHALARMRHEAREAEHAENLFRHARERAREATHRLADIEKRLEQAQSKEHVNAKEVYRLKQLEIAQRRKERDAIKEQTQAEKEATKERDQATKAAEKWKQLQQELVSQAQSIAQVITDQGAIFGGQGTSLTVGGILAKLRAANEDAGKFRHYINQLRGMGLDERIIQQLLEQGPTPEGVAAARNLAHAGVGQIRNINRQERQLVGVAASTGALGVRGGAGINVTMNINKVETQNIRDWERSGNRIMRRALRVAMSK